MTSAARPLTGAVVLGTLIVLAACGGSAAAPAASPAASTAAQSTPPSAAGSGAGTAPGQAASGAVDPAMQQLIDGARKEGQLDLVWGYGTVGDSTGVGPFADGFNKAYGLNVKVNYTPGPDMATFSANVVQAVKAAKAPQTDVYLGFPENYLQLTLGDAMEQVDWSWAPNIKDKDPGMLAPKGIGVAIQDGIPDITYNSQRLKGDQVPQALADLLKPQYKGHIASTPYAAHFAELGTDQFWGPQKLNDYLTKFSQQVAGLIRCNEQSRIASGEFDVLAIDCAQNTPDRAKAQGQPIDWVVPSDAAMVDLIYMGVPKLAVHPDAAKLFINYMASKEAQDLTYKIDYGDTHFVPGSHTAQLLDGLKAKGVKITPIDVQWEQASASTIADLTKKDMAILATAAPK